MNGRQMSLKRFVFVYAWAVSFGEIFRPGREETKGDAVIGVNRQVRHTDTDIRATNTDMK